MTTAPGSRVAPRGPVDPRLLGRASATRAFLVAGVVSGSVTALLVVWQAWLLSGSIVSVVETRTLDGVGRALGWLSLVLVGRAVLAYATTWLAHRSAAAVKSQLRTDIAAARLADPVAGTTSSAELVTLVTQGLDALDGYFAKYLPQLVLAVTVPLVVGAAVLWADWQAAAIMAATIPLIPLFMALVGWTTEATVRRRWRYQARLARHFADLVMGLPTLQVFGRARAQAEGLRRTEEANRTETMATLRISFLSAFALELLSTLAVAIVALTVGTRLVYHGIDFRWALFVLILAPEVYLPVRQVGVHYHDSADGVAAAEAAFAVIDAAPGARVDNGAPDHANWHDIEGTFVAQEVGEDPKPATWLDTEAGDGPGRLTGGQDRHDRATWHDSAVPSPTNQQHCGQKREYRANWHDMRTRVGSTQPHQVQVLDVAKSFTLPALAPTSFDITPGQVVAISGPSGCGKSTLLLILLGFLEPTSGGVLVNGHPLSHQAPRAWRRQLAYVPQTPGLIAGTIADNVRLGHQSATVHEVREALGDAGAADLTPGRSVGDDGEGLSAGERRRVGIARALLRIRLGGAWLLVLDEPTAGLDADAEAAVVASVRASGAGAVVVSHRPAVVDAADRIVRLEAPVRLFEVTAP